MALPSLSPDAWIRVHSIAAIIWALLMVPALLWWAESVPFLIICSVYANFAGSMASLQSAKADCNSPNREDVERLSKKLDNVQAELMILIARAS